VLARRWMMPWPIPRFDPVITTVKGGDIVVKIGSFDR
jgi:hypothetical protein